jgi:hypothetical protein
MSYVDVMKESDVIELLEKALKNNVDNGRLFTDSIEFAIRKIKEK